MRFIDVSIHQGDIQMGALSGVDAVIIKATEGYGYTDPACDQLYQQAKAAGLRRGVYHFAGASGGRYLNDPTQEADWFVDNTAGYHRDAILVLDYEPYGYSNDDDHPGWVAAFCRRVHDRIGVWPVVYGNYEFVAGDGHRDIAQHCALWMPAYLNGPYTVDAPPDGTPSYPGFWTLFAWQYTSTGRAPGYWGNLDLNIAYVDAAGWDNYANPDGTTVTTGTHTADTAITEEDEIMALTDETLDAIAARVATLKLETNHGVLSLAEQNDRVLAALDTLAGLGGKLDALTAAVAEARKAGGDADVQITVNGRPI